MAIEVYEMLVPLVEEVERHGRKPDHIRFNFKPESDDFILLKNRFSPCSDEDIYTALKAAIANDYLSHTSIGLEYELKLTTRGFYAGQSRKAMAVSAEQKGTIEKFSDYIDRHNGLLTLYAVIASTIGLPIAASNLSIVVSTFTAS